MTSFIGMDIAAVENVQMQLVAQTQQLESVVTAIQAATTSISSPAVWTGVDAEQFRATLNDQLVALRALVPAFESLTQNLGQNVAAQRAASSS